MGQRHRLLYGHGSHNQGGVADRRAAVARRTDQFEDSKTVCPIWGHTPPRRPLRIIADPVSWLWPLLIVLLFQTILLAHGGLTTLGANVFSMAVVGPLVAYGLFRGLRGAGVSFAWTVFIAALLSDLATYFTTSVQMALAFPAPEGGVLESFVKFVSIFAVTQVPLAIAEGILTVIVFNLLEQYNREVLEEQGVLAPRAPVIVPAAAEPARVGA